MKMKPFLKRISMILYIALMLSPMILLFLPISSTDTSINFINESNPGVTKSNLETSDIAGTDLYAEQISAYVTGAKSIIRQSLFTNDTNIFTHFDMNDPAFYKCNIFISATNGIVPEIFPNVLTDNFFGTQFGISFNSFIGFLYYDSAVTKKDADKRAERALEIIKRKFEMDLIMVNVSESNLYPFIGYYPDWEVFFKQILTNLPMDGYWKALDRERLLSSEYLESHHLSATYFLINSLELIENGINITTDQLDFNFGQVDLSYLQNLDMTELLSTASDAIGTFGTMFGNLSQFMAGGVSNETTYDTLSADELAAMTSAFGTFQLANDSHYATLMLQYEGEDSGIQKQSNGKYHFNLWDAMGYNGTALSPSQKIYIALMGAFMSEIDINILCTDIVDSTPQYFQLSDYLLDQISFLLFIAGQNINIEQLKEYSLELLWVNEDGIYRNYVRPVNLVNPDDPVNMLEQFGFAGLPYVPTGLLNPLEDLIITYNISNAEPNMIITKELLGNNASFGLWRDFQFKITAQNVGNLSVWGIPTEVNIDLVQLFNTFFFGQGQAFYNAMWDAVDATYPGKYDSLEDFFNLDEDPRIFFYDTWGSRVVDHYYPDLTNPANMMPYQPDIVPIINAMGYWLQLAGLNPALVAAMFTNPESIWNDANWELKPGETYVYNSTVISMGSPQLAPLYNTYSSFNTYSYKIRNDVPYLPALISGNTEAGTAREMGYKTDNINWTINSEERYVDRHEVDVHIIFENTSYIDLEENVLERVAIQLNLTLSDVTVAPQFQIYNFSSDQFESMPLASSGLYSYSRINDTWTFSFSRHNESTLDWIFDPTEENNYTVYFRIIATDTSSFSVDLDGIKLRLMNRDINTYNVSGSRVMYSSKNGRTQLERTSNEFHLSSYSMASIMSRSYLTTYNSEVGEISTFTIYLKNIGSEIAENVNISLLVPGIIKNKNGWTVANDLISYSLPAFNPGAQQVLSFSFYIPNSQSINDVKISYHNPRNINGGTTSEIISYSNEIYICAPVDYDTRRPFLRSMQIIYEASDYAPDIGENFTLTVHVINESPEGINLPDLRFNMNDQFGDLIRIDTESLSINQVEYDKSKSFTLTLKKRDWKAYFYPSVNNFISSEARTIQISRSLPLILGTINFKINKTVDRPELELGDSINISITIKNTGTICAKHIVVADMISFTQEEFGLMEGKLVNEIEKLDAGESVTIEYTIKSKSQKLITLREASIEYYYLEKHVDQSNELQLKVVLPFWIRVSLILIPCIIALLIALIYYRQTHKYKEVKFETQRIEMDIFTMASHDSIIRIEHTLRERLNLIASKLITKQKTKEPQKTEIKKEGFIKKQIATLKKQSPKEIIKKEGTPPVKIEVPLTQEPVKDDDRTKILKKIQIAEKEQLERKPEEFVTFDVSKINFETDSIEKLKKYCELNNLKVSAKADRKDLIKIIKKDIAKSAKKERGRK